MFQSSLAMAARGAFCGSSAVVLLRFGCVWSWRVEAFWLDELQLLSSFADVEA